MASSMILPCRNAPKFLDLNQTVPINVGTMKKSYLKRAEMQLNNGVIFGLKSTRKRNGIHQRNISFAPILAAESDSILPSPSLPDVIRRFYTYINEKNLQQIEDLISSECILEDSTFPNSFQGKKEVMSFFEQLVQSMGQNVHFRTGMVCEGDELTATVDWHLEWKEDQIPFSRGCSIFQCSIEDDRLVIRKAQNITESPIKPGKIAMCLLKTIASLCDDFPQAAKWFLKSQQTIFKAVLKIYNLLVAPICNPVLAFYITLWQFTVKLLSYLISFLHVLAKIFNKNSPIDGASSSDSTIL